MKYELYEIYNKDNITFNYTNNVEDLTIEGKDYTAQSISRNEIEIDGEKDDLTLTVPMFLSPFNEYILFNPNLDYWFKIYTLINGVKTLLYTGKIVEVSYDNEKNEATVRCSSLITILSSNIPTKRYSPSCPYRLFDEDCGLNREDYSFVVIPANYTILNNKSIQLLNLTFTKSFNRGLFFLNGQPLFCINHKANYVLEFGEIITNLDDTGDLTGSYGCNKTLDNCNGYNNKTKFGGFPFIPKSNPYLGF